MRAPHSFSAASPSPRPLVLLEVELLAVLFVLWQFLTSTVLEPPAVDSERTRSVPPHL